MAKELYIISGLGADERVFQKLDFSRYKVTFIHWIPPQDNEVIEHYATRLLEQIKTTKPILLGLSFGGIMAVEIAKQIETEKVILIASAKTKSEIPFYLRFIGSLGIHNIIPARLLKSSNILTHWFFGITSEKDNEVFSQILKDTDPIFLKWAIDKIVSWSNRTLLRNVYHIHGERDRILPKFFVNCDVTIKNNGHLLPLTEPDVVTGVLRELLEFEEENKQ